MLIIQTLGIQYVYFCKTFISHAKEYPSRVEIYFRFNNHQVGMIPENFKTSHEIFVGTLAKKSPDQNLQKKKFLSQEIISVK